MGKNISKANYISRKGIIEVAFNARKAEYIESFKNLDYSLLYKRVSDYSKTQDYYKAIQ